MIELHFGLLYAGDIGALADTKKREKKEIEMGEWERRGSGIIERERLSRLPNFIGDYHNVPCLWTGSIVAPLALSGYAAGFARGKAWILEVHYRRTQVDRYTYLLLGIRDGFFPWLRCRCRLRRQIRRQAV